MLSIEAICEHERSQVFLEAGLINMCIELERIQDITRGLDMMKAKSAKEQVWNIIEANFSMKRYCTE